MDELQIELTPQECEGSTVVGFKFKRLAGGGMAITEQWDGHDELYADGVMIRIPARVWNEALAWFTASANAGAA